jgi:hypothetical protein
MGDWPQPRQPWNQVTIAPSSPDSLGIALSLIQGATDSASTAWPAANRAIFVPFVIHEPFLLQQMLAFHGTSVTGNADLGVYDALGNRIVASGSTAISGTTTTAAYNVTDTVLNPGAYYMAIACSSTGAIIGWAGPAAQYAAGLGAYQMASAFPLPSTATFAAPSSGFVPCIAVSGRALL